MIPPTQYLVLAGLIFSVGGVGFLVRRNVLVTLMSIELMLNAVNLTLVAFNRMRPNGMGGQMFAFFLIAAEAAEVAVGLAIIVALFRTRQSVETEAITKLQG